MNIIPPIVFIQETKNTIGGIMKNLTPEHIFGHEFENTRILHVDEVIEMLGDANALPDWMNLHNHECGYEAVRFEKISSIDKALDRAHSLSKDGRRHCLVIESYC